MLMLSFTDMTVATASGSAIWASCGNLLISESRLGLRRVVNLRAS
jgi:hypothetical protein